ncbi:dUTP diphosphatase [Chamaesiphon sp.]|uniref:dUTP diphosphatase n=1 Tax=Chamaesiphon sp. TaxID=2814140 RepID=UPI0035933F23
MISVEYVLAEPEFKPLRAVDRAAALDIKAYLPTPPKNFIESLQAIKLSFLGKYPEGFLYINGKKITEDLTTELLQQSEPQLRFFSLAPGEQKIINAGFKVGLSTDRPDKIATMLVCPRSGLACKNSITAINSPGIVDEHYPDWVGVGLINHGRDLHLFSHGARIAQVMFLEVCVAQERVVAELTTVGERKGGFGHTGV